MSAIRLNPPGKPVRLILLGHDEPIPRRAFDGQLAIMRVPLTDRLASTQTPKRDVAA